MDLNVYTRTFLMNALFIVAIPLLFSYMTFSNWVLLLYVPAFSLIETVYDIFFYSKKDITKLPDKFPVLEFVLTTAFNFILLFACSLIFANITRFSAYITGGSYVFILGIMILSTLLVISAFEIVFDYYVYKRISKYARLK